jgi:hypothetical protein
MYDASLTMRFTPIIGYMDGIWWCEPSEMLFAQRWFLFESLASLQLVGVGIFTRYVMQNLSVLFLTFMNLCMIKMNKNTFSYQTISRMSLDIRKTVQEVSHNGMYDGSLII